MTTLLHVGFGNYVLTAEVLGVFKYDVPAIKRLVSNAKEDKMRNVLNLTKGRKAVSLVVLKGDRYVVSAIPVPKLIKRIDPSLIPENTNE